MNQMLFHKLNLVFRPLTADDIAQRRELLRQKQIEKPTTTTNEESTNQTVENQQPKSENGVALNPTTATTTTTESNEELDDNAFLAFARVFSGRIKRGQKIYVLSPRHDPSLFVDKVK